MKADIFSCNSNLYGEILIVLRTKKLEGIQEKKKNKTPHYQK